ncbi:MAG: hypothetical protein EVG15_09770 [Candidatus Acididesulfobacter diazotrophicus]|jgi:hypothetical protein|uniref:Uncharacterized protein n=1 Tax=Candidatus Acididesulfobacter diazotrophicus TaxID=2597226 RepID=A0A519BKA4_9DELT|nr:MAG: hypothetical protein EVG15_09770 [Candidatus Acididesulfobacter diazotrophicus]
MWFKKQNNDSGNKNSINVPVLQETDQAIKILEEELHNKKHKSGTGLSNDKLAAAALKIEAFNAFSLAAKSASDLVNIFIEKSKYDKLIDLQLTKMQIEANLISQSEDRRFMAIMALLETLKKSLQDIIAKALAIDPGNCNDREWEYSQMLYKDATSQLNRIIDIISQYI